MIRLRDVQGLSAGLDPAVEAREVLSAATFRLHPLRGVREGLTEYLMDQHQFGPFPSFFPSDSQPRTGSTRRLPHQSAELASSNNLLALTHRGRCR